MAEVLRGSTEIPVAEMMNPRNATEVFKKEHFYSSRRLANNCSSWSFAQTARR